MFEDIAGPDGVMTEDEYISYFTEVEVRVSDEDEEAA